jgi:hypothetical protein
MDQPLDRGRLRRKMQALLRQTNRQWTEEGLHGLVQELVPTSDAALPAIRSDQPPAPLPEPGLHPAARYSRRIGLWSLLLGVARLTPPSLFWWQVGFVWLAGIAFIVDIRFERWRRWVKWCVATIVVVLELAYSYASGIGSAVPLDIAVFGSTSDYATGTMVANMPWSMLFSEVDIDFINNTSFDYEDISLVVRPELPIVSIVQSADDPVPITIGDATWSTMKQELVENTGKRTANQLILVASDSGYMIHCERLPGYSHIGTKALTALIPPFSKGAPTNHPENGGIFDSDYVLRIDYNPIDETPLTSKWFAHAKSVEIFERICGMRKLPSYVEVSGSYNANARKHNIPKHKVLVKDMLGDAIPSIRKDIENKH